LQEKKEPAHKVKMVYEEVIAEKKKRKKEKRKKADDVEADKDNEFDADKNIYVVEPSETLRAKTSPRGAAAAVGKMAGAKTWALPAHLPPPPYSGPLTSAGHQLTNRMTVTDNDGEYAEILDVEPTTTKK